MRNGVTPKKMNLAALPENTGLRKLLASCKLEHEIVMTECSDGALIFDCLECPFHKILDSVEEEYIRKEELPSQESAKTSF